MRFSCGDANALAQPLVENDCAHQPGVGGDGEAEENDYGLLTVDYGLMTNDNDYPTTFLNLSAPLDS
jgi:hypothetical protein